MRKRLYDCSFFLGSSILVVLVLGMILLMYNKAQVHLWLNAYHTPFLDTYFRYYTIVGEWIPYVVVLGLLWYKAGWACFLLTSLITSGLLGQLFKHLLVAPRPITYFATYYPDVQLPLVKGVEMAKSLSFPSGHTISFFALFLTLCLLVSNLPVKRYVARMAETLFFCLAILGAYSRIYLSQHFAFDIVGGMVIGIATTLLLTFCLDKVQNSPFFDWNLRFLCKKNKK